jgi:hypothetical protein
MNVGRPEVDELEVVASDHLVFRFVQPGHINLNAPAGSRLQLSALQTNECTPNERSYGASVYVKSRLAYGLADIHAAFAKSRSWRAAEVPVWKIQALGVSVVLSPQDCSIEAIRHAHASLIGVDKPRRNKLIRIIEEHLLTASGD